MTGDFLYEVDGPIARITLNRPDVLNALTVETYTGLRDLFLRLKDDATVRVVVLTGKGRAFCSGGDVRAIIGRLQGRPDEELLAFTRLTCEVVLLMRQAPQIIIASLNGVTAGGGAALALASDLRVAADTARIAFLFVKVGLSGADMGVAHILPRLIGAGRAAEMLLRGEFVDARTAERWGLIHHVAAPHDLTAETDALARSLASGPRLALAVTKTMINRSLGFNLQEALEAEAEVQALCMKHPDFQEAYEAFLEKRPPRFGSRG
ncbi:MAG TPA: enoyl-CoA hydratase family protein [Candidatus Polarisedimenticolia bacterium]|nr:enoyl-CoA hydratase family protein [Candidatus Polarisedimenticolia bacterium]